MVTRLHRPNTRNLQLYFDWQTMGVMTINLPVILIISYFVLRPLRFTVISRVIWSLYFQAAGLLHIWYLRQSVEMATNPYLAHSPPSQRGASSSNSGSKLEAAADNGALVGFWPRKVKGDQVRKALVGQPCGGLH
jgi:hypothetical protein